MVELWGQFSRYDTVGGDNQSLAPRPPHFLVVNANAKCVCPQLRRFPGGRSASAAAFSALLGESKAFDGLAPPLRAQRPVATALCVHAKQHIGTIVGAPKAWGEQARSRQAAFLLTIRRQPKVGSVGVGEPTAAAAAAAAAAPIAHQGCTLQQFPCPQIQ